MSNKPSVAIVMGSSSDWDQVKPASEILDELNISYTKAVVSAHRMPDDMFEFAKSAHTKGIQVIIAAAGGAAHLPGMIASQTHLPVIGIPIKTSTLNGVDSLLSIVQMPGGVPVATMAIGPAGARNAALYAAQILSLNDESLVEKLLDFRQNQYENAVEMSADLN